jgi:hypothetical protein
MRGFSPVLCRPSLPKTGSIEEQVFEKLGTTILRHYFASLFCVTTLRHLAGDLLETHIHYLGVGIRQDRAGIASRADGAIRATV